MRDKIQAKQEEKREPEDISQEVDRAALNGVFDKLARMNIQNA